MTDAIFRVANQVKEKFTDQNEFIKYLKVSLKNAKTEYYRKEEKKLIQIPKGQLQKIKDVIEYVRMLECKKQMQLPENEKIRDAAEWFNTSEEKMRKIFDKIAIMENMSTYNDEVLIDDDIYHEENPESIYINSQLSMEKSDIIHEALESVFKTRYEKTKPLIRALFTAQCLNEKINNDWLEDNFDWINEYLDNDTLEFYKNNGKAPTNREIFLKYKPEAKNPDQQISPYYSEFISDFKKALKKRNIKFFS